MSIEVSVFVMTYNQAKYIKQCIESCLSQKTSFKYEILINDDCSTDGTKEIILEYEKQYPERIRVVTHEQNMYSQGFMPDNEFLYPIAKGKYFAFCEGDDYWCDNDKLQKQYTLMEKNIESPMCVHASYNINANNNSLKSVNRPYPNDCVVSRDKVLGEVHAFATASYFIRRTAYESYIESGMINQKAHGDFNMSIYYATIGPILYIEKPMSVYRCGAVGSISESIFLQKRNERYKEVKRIYENRCSSLNYLDKITNNQFHKEIEQGKQFCEYEYLYDTGKFKDLKQRHRERYSKEKTKSKIKLYLKGICPKLYFWLGTIKQSIEKKSKG